MKLLWCFIVLVGIVLVSTHQNINKNEKVNGAKDIHHKHKNHKTDVHRWSMVAAIWLKATTMSIIPTLSCTGVIISEKHVLTHYHCIDDGTTELPIESIGVSYGVYDTKNIKFADLNIPIKKFMIQSRGWYYFYVLEMPAIKYSKLVQPACISPEFDFTEKTLTVTGFSRLGQIKTLQTTSMLSLTKCGWEEIDTECICHSITPITDESNLITGGSPIQWFNPSNKKWILVGISSPWENYIQLNSPLLYGYNLTFFYENIKQIVEDGSSKLSTC